MDKESKVVIAIYPQITTRNLERGLASERRDAADRSSPRPRTRRSDAKEQTRRLRSWLVAARENHDRVSVGERGRARGADA